MGSNREIICDRSFSPPTHLHGPLHRLPTLLTPSKSCQGATSGWVRSPHDEFTSFVREGIRGLTNTPKCAETSHQWGQEQKLIRSDKKLRSQLDNQTIRASRAIAREQKGKYKCMQLQSAKKSHDKCPPPPTHPHESPPSIPDLDHTEQGVPRCHFQAGTVVP